MSIDRTRVSDSVSWRLYRAEKPMPERRSQDKDANVAQNEQRHVVDPKEKAVKSSDNTE